VELNLRRLLIVSHVVHYRRSDLLYAYGPYAREIDIWADLFPKVFIAAPCRLEPPPGDALAFTRPNIQILPQPETGGLSLQAKIHQILMLPVLFYSLARAMQKADAIHVRCPGNLGLLGVLLAPLFSHYRIAKYAGQWKNYPGEPWSVRLQKKLLGSKWWGEPVTVYGEWLNQPSHVIPFFTSVMDETQMESAKAASVKPFHDPLNILYAGRLSKSKNIDVLIKALRILVRKGFIFKCNIVGDGPERAELEGLVRGNGLREEILFHGSVPFEEVLDLYERSDLLILVSETEGWPKAIAEGMAFGLICIGSNRGLVPWMLGEGRGVVVEPRSVEALASVLRSILSNPGAFKPVRERAAVWAQQFTLERLRTDLRKTLEDWWGVRFGENG
jgi:glycosyltransferase involved in cell wall biosynthesis